MYLSDLLSHCLNVLHMMLKFAITLKLEKPIRLSPAHLRLRGGLGDNNRLPQFGLEVHLIVSVPEEVPLDGWSRFPCES